MGTYTDIELKVRLSSETPEHIVHFLDEYINRFNGSFAQAFWLIEDEKPVDETFLKLIDYCREHDELGYLYLMTKHSVSVIHGGHPVGGNRIFSQDEAYSLFKRGKVGETHELSFLSDLYDYHDGKTNCTPIEAFLNWIEAWIVNEPGEVVGLLQQERFFGTTLKDIIVHQEPRVFLGKDKNDLGDLQHHWC